MPKTDVAATPRSTASGPPAELQDNQNILQMFFYLSLPVLIISIAPYFCQYTENANTTTETSTSVCNVYCDTFTLSYPQSICGCIQASNDTEPKDPYEGSTEVDTQQQASIVCQHTDMLSVDKATYSHCLVDVCKDDFGNSTASCSTCAANSKCGTPSPPKTTIYITLVACMKEHLITLCE